MDVIPLPVVITKEGKWFVACCPLLDIATQGRTEKEVRGNMRDLIDDYLKDPDTPKPELEAIMSASVVMTSILARIPKGAYHRKASPAAAT